MRMISIALIALLVEAQALAGQCCNTPTVWTFKNLDAAAVTLTCRLDKSVAWKGDPIELTTAKIAASASYKHQWSREWYADGMGMIPGTWSCMPKGKTAGQAEPLVFTTDWGENVTITWNKSKGTVARK